MPATDSIATGRLLQLLPPQVSGETGVLAETVVAAFSPDTLTKGDVRREVVRHPLLNTWALLASRFGGAGVVHAVGRAVRACVGSQVPVIYTPDIRVRKGDVRVLRMLARRVPVVGLVATAQAKATLEKADAGLSAIEVVPPLWQAAGPREIKNNELRERMGFTSDDLVVAAIGESHRASNHTLALWALGILGFTSPRWRLVLAGRGEEVSRMERFAKMAGPPGLVNFAPQSTTRQLLEIADFVIDTSNEQNDSRPLIEALAMQLPLLAVDSPQARTWLSKELIVEKATPKVMARHLLDMVEEQEKLEQNQAAVAVCAERMRAIDPLAIVRKALADLPITK